MYMTVLKMDKNSILTAEKPLDLTKTYDVHQWVTYQQDRKREEDKILYRVYNTTKFFTFIVIAGLNNNICNSRVFF